MKRTYQGVDATEHTAERLEYAPWVHGYRWLIDDEWVAQIPNWAWDLVEWEEACPVPEAHA